MLQRNAMMPVDANIFFYFLIFITCIGLVFLVDIYLFSMFLFGIIGLIVVFWCLKKPVRFVYFQILYNCFIKYMITDFGISYMANYVSDIITTLLIMIALLEWSRKRLHIGVKWPMLCIVVMFLSGVFSYVCNSSSNLYLFLWSFRNYYRFFGFFLGCSIFLKHEDIDQIFRILAVVLYANVLMCTYQYFGLEIRGDYLGGFFGTSQGCNAYMNILLCILTIQSTAFFLTKRLSTFVLLSIVASAIYIALLSEIKIYFIELFVVIVIVSLLIKPNKRTLAVIVGCIVCCIIGIKIFYSLYPEFSGFFSYESIMNSVSYKGYSNAYNLNRLTALRTIQNIFFHDPFQKLFGIGMGNAETSQFPLFTSSIFSLYGRYLNYSWFSHAFLFLEGGWIGLVSYCSFFVIIFLNCFSSIFRNNHKSIYNSISATMALLCFLQIIYNSSLRTEAGYFVFFVLAIPFAIKRRECLCKRMDSSVSSLNLNV